MHELQASGHQLLKYWEEQLVSVDEHALELTARAHRDIRLLVAFVDYLVAGHASLLEVIGKTSGMIGQAIAETMKEFPPREGGQDGVEG